MDQAKVDLNLKAARDAAAHARQVLWDGMANFWNAPWDQRVRTRTLKAAGSVVGAALNPMLAVPLLGSTAVGVVWDTLAIGARRIEDRESHGDALSGAGEYSKLRQWHLTEDMARRAQDTGRGNCEEHARVAFRFLRDACREARPVEIVCKPGGWGGWGSHVFVLIGRIAGNGGKNAAGAMTLDDPAAWGDGVVICDAYYDECYLLEGGRLHAEQAGARLVLDRIE